MENGISNPGKWDKRKMQRSFTLENERPGRYSAALQSLYQLEGEIALTTEAADTSGLYGHTVLIQTGNVIHQQYGFGC